MSHATYKLISTYEHVPESLQFHELFRIEIFQGVSDPTRFRCRVWNYRHYTLMVSPPLGGLESHDILAQDVTVILQDTSLITGISNSSEQEVLARALVEIEKLLQVLNS